MSDEPIPGVAACLEDGIVGFEDPIAEFVAAQIGPDVFDRVQLRAVWRQVEQGDIVGDSQFIARLMPACAIDDEKSMRAGSHVEADFDQMQVHHLGVGERQDESGAIPAT